MTLPGHLHDVERPLERRQEPVRQLPHTGQRAVIRPQRIPVQKGPDIAVEARVDAVLHELAGTLEGAVPEADATRNVTVKIRFGPVRRPAPRGCNQHRLIARGLIPQSAPSRLSRSDKTTTAALRQLDHDVEEVQPQTAHQNLLACGQALPVDVGRNVRRPVLQSRAGGAVAQFLLLRAEPGR